MDTTPFNQDPSKTAGLVLDVGSGSKGYCATSRGNICLDIGTPDKVPPFFIKGDVHSLPLRSELFDKVYFYDVIEHVDSPIKALQEINRVLRPKGRLELSTPNPLHYRKFLRAARNKDLLLTPVPDHITTWTDAEMRNILVRTNFDRIQVDFTILEATRICDHRHMKYDLLLFKLLPSLVRVTGRSMIVHARKASSK